MIKLGHVSDYTRKCRATLLRFRVHNTTNPFILQLQIEHKRVPNLTARAPGTPFKRVRKQAVTEFLRPMNNEHEYNVMHNNACITSKKISSGPE
jgi:hypothetical protein